MAKHNSIRISVGETYGALTVAGRCGGGWWSCICKNCGKGSLLKPRQLVKDPEDCEHCREYEGSQYQDYPGEYAVWSGMKQRCMNSRAQGYKLYGGRGIAVCQEWIDSFDRFIEDMGPRPSADYSLDRLDTDGDYEPANCHWADRNAQSRGTRGNRQLTAGGRTQTLPEWAAEIGISITSLNYRLKHWDQERALTEPPHQKGKRKRS